MSTRRRGTRSGPERVGMARKPGEDIRAFTPVFAGYA
jgi:hypothetical protein